MELPSNACIRTDVQWDKAVRHLGYEPVDVLKENAGNLRTDTEIIAESQERLSKVQVIPDDQLTGAELASLELIRAINNQNSGAQAVNAADIPAASDRVKTAGMYGRHDERIYMGREYLASGRQAVGVGIHEISHHKSGGGDDEDSHRQAIDSLSETVINQVSRGDYNEQLKNPAFVW